MHRPTQLLPALLLAVAVAGCTFGVDGAAPEVPSASTQDVPPVDDAPDADTPDGDGPDGDAPAAAGDCSPGDVAAMDTAIAGQLDAIVARDFEAALDFSTEGFRAQFDGAAFGETILEGFPVVADAQGHDSAGCVRAGADAQLLVTVTADDGRTVQLVYLMALEGDAWRIGGAVPHDGAGADQDTTVV